jgi:hypothetical protein
MSSAARWSYTSTATLWPRLGRDDWTGLVAYGPPEAFACDYSAESKRMTDAAGVEFTTRQILFTELATAKQGDMVLIGESAVASPIAAGALEVRAVTRFADTFEQQADDWKIVT